MRQRLQKLISARGITSRRAAEDLLRRGMIRVNGNIALLGESADPDTDEILICGKPLPAEERRVYLALNKPRGYVTSMSDEKGRADVSELVSDCGVRVYPVGRLDLDSEGLLLFTNDGAFANHMMHPSSETDKCYQVSVTGFSSCGFQQLQLPMKLDGYTLRRPKLDCLHIDGNRASFQMTIHEGRNRQIRRMCQNCGMHVVRLVRIREGCVTLGTLQPGKWRYLTEDEIHALGFVGQ